jgi:Holliday junction resolvasome RuvABC endonuclease subunit
VTAPRVVGLDLSMTATGLVTVLGNAATVRPLRKGDWRLMELADNVLVFAADADLVVIEDLVTRTPAASITGMVHGAIRTMLLRSGIPYVLLTPATLKKFATGRGNAGKPEMAVALFKRAGLELTDDNQVDAAWLRFAGLTMLGHPPFPLPVAQLAALPELTPNGDARA